jgi:hypothetical protein
MNEKMNNNNNNNNNKSHLLINTSAVVNKREINLSKCSSDYIDYIT